MLKRTVPLIIALLLLLFSCKKEESSPFGITGQTAKSVTYINAAGKEKVLTKKPERVVVVHGSLLNLWHAAGGNVVGRPTVRIKLPAELKKVEEIGGMTTFNTEKILALDPDLVILSGNISKQDNLEKLLDQCGIENVRITYNNYRDYFRIQELFTALTGKEELYKKEILPLKKEIASIIKKTEGKKAPRILLLFSSTRYVKCEIPLESTDTALILKMLGAENIAADAAMEEAKYVNFSMEQVIARDPDLILIKTMGDISKCKERLEKDIKSHEAWSGLKAVKAGEVHFLPNDLFMYKANERYPEAFDYLAKILYKE